MMETRKMMTRITFQWGSLKRIQMTGILRKGTNIFCVYLSSCFIEVFSTACILWLPFPPIKINGWLFLHKNVWRASFVYPQSKGIMHCLC
jgi:hypothetical protein